MMEAKTEYETFDGLAYRQMRLFVWELTPEQEKKYNKEFKLNPLRAKVSEAKNQLYFQFILVKAFLTKLNLQILR